MCAAETVGYPGDREREAETNPSHDCLLIVSHHGGMLVLSDDDGSDREQDV